LPAWLGRNADHRHREQWRHDPHAEADGRFQGEEPRHHLEWVTLEENVLRQKVTTDIATKGGQYDVLTIGTYEVPIWAKQGWLLPLDNLGADYDVDDLLPAIRSGLTADGKLYAAPFYGESSMVMYRKDLFEKAGLKMPDAPTWDFIGEAARKITDKGKASTASAFAARPAGARTWPS
jgi:sorbitol/mannitol transport system substrate-binding protein